MCIRDSAYRASFVRRGSFVKPDNVRVIPDAGDVEIVGADEMAKLSAETSKGRSVAACDQRFVIRFGHHFVVSLSNVPTSSDAASNNIPCFDLGVEQLQSVEEIVEDLGFLSRFSIGELFPEYGYVSVIHVSFGVSPDVNYDANFCV